MNFKKPLIIFVALVLCGKLFAVALIRLATTPANQIALHMADNSVFEFLRHGEALTKKQIVKITNQTPRSIKNFATKANQIKVQMPMTPQAQAPVLNFAQQPLSEKDRSKILAANEQKALEDKKLEEDKKEKERRKKRRKKLEALANKQVQPQVFEKIANAYARSSQPATTNYSGATSYFAQIQTPQTKKALNKSLANAHGSTPTLHTTGVSKKNVDISKWSDQLANHPTEALMTSFINLYRTAQITPVQYYQVLGQMQKSKVVDARKYAIAACALEQRSESFDLLASNSFSESDPQIQIITSQSLQSYQSIDDVKIFTQEISSGSIEAKLRATELLGQLLNSYVVNRTAPKNAQNLLAPVLPALNSLSKNGNLELQANVANIIQLIEKLPRIIASY